MLFFEKEPQAPSADLLLAAATLRVALSKALYDGELSPLVRLVHVFDLVSVWEDWAVSGESTLPEAVKLYVQKLGRDKHGVNRTKRGERVTPEKVYLGGEDGFWTFTVTEWLEKFPANDEAQRSIERQARTLLAYAETLVRVLS